MAPEAYSGSLTHLRAAGVSVVVDTRGGGLPAVLHGGHDLGDLTNGELSDFALALMAPAGDSLIDVPERVSILLTPAEGWVGTPGLVGSRNPGAVQLPAWWESGVTVSGRVLDGVGVQIPAMFPEYAHLIRATAETGAP